MPTLPQNRRSLGWLLLGMAGCTGLILVAATIARRAVDRPVLLPAAPEHSPAERAAAVASDCQQMATWLARQVPSSWPVLIRAPWLISGDLAAQTLDRHYATVVLPVVEAMRRDFCNATAPQPCALLLFGTASAYRQHGRRLTGRPVPSGSGFYQHHLRLIFARADVPEAVRHELTHALLAIDFPAAPQWLAEGLACLTEGFTVQGPSGQRSTPTWRLAVARQALAEGTLPTLRDSGDEILPPGAERDRRYATAYAFCLFLERSGVLGRCYRAMRASPSVAQAPWPTIDALLSLGPSGTSDEAFRAFLRSTQ